MVEEEVPPEILGSNDQPIEENQPVTESNLQEKEEPTITESNFPKQRPDGLIDLESTELTY